MYHHFRIILLSLFIVFLCLNCTARKKKESSPPNIVTTSQSQTIVSKPPIYQIDQLPKVEYNRTELLQPLFNAMAIQQEEKLPFDEPRREFGLQLDGQLRKGWEWAYKKGKRSYIVSYDVYNVFGKHGVSLVPQVCADFIIDTIDRAAGTWYYSLKDKKRGRSIGKLDLRTDINSMGLNSRRIEDLITYFRFHPNNFEFIYDSEVSNNISPEVGRISELQCWLKELNVQLGDIIIIKGKAPWDYETKMHYHSMFVTKFDEDGSVSYITGNPAIPRESKLKNEVNRAPKRKVVYIIRLTNEFLEKLNYGI